MAIRPREAAETGYREGLLDAPPAELEALLAGKNRATIDLDRAEVLVAAPRTRIAELREAEARADRQEIYLDATRQCEAIRGRLPVEYACHASAIRHLPRDLAQSDVARHRAGSEAPDFPVIASPEVELRALYGLPEQIVSTETVALWVIDGRTDPVPADRQGAVRRYDERRDRGTLLMPGSAHHSAPTSGVALPCTLRQFVRTRTRDSVAGRNDGSLLPSVALPSFTGDVPCFVTASPYRDHNGALIEPSADIPPPAPRHRPILEKLELVPAVRGLPVFVLSDVAERTAIVLSPNPPEATGMARPGRKSGRFTTIEVQRRTTATEAHLVGPSYRLERIGRSDAPQPARPVWMVKQGAGAHQLPGAVLVEIKLE